MCVHELEALGGLDISEDLGDAAAVTLAINGQPQEQLTRLYTFTLTHEDGWKVCTATQTE